MSALGQGLKNSERAYLVRTTSETEPVGHIGGTFEKCHNRTLRDGGLARFHWLIKLTHARQWEPEPRLVAPLNARPLTAAGEKAHYGVNTYNSTATYSGSKGGLRRSLFEASFGLGDRRHAWPAIRGSPKMRKSIDILDLTGIAHVPPVRTLRQFVTRVRHGDVRTILL